MAKGISLHIGLKYLDPQHYLIDGKLNAPEKDASDMQFICKNLKPAFQTTKLLVNDQAKKVNVVSYIENASKILEINDLFLVSFSGHGGMLPNYNSDDEETGYDQTWCLYDSMIVDDELSKLWLKFKQGVRILIISDSCYSGSIMKMVDEGKKRDKNGYFSKYIDEKLLLQIYKQNQVYYDSILKAPKTNHAVIKSKIIQLSACSDTEETTDGHPNSIFTACLKKVWKSGGFQSNYDNFLNEISKNVKNFNPNQNPQIKKINDQNNEFSNYIPFKI